MEPALWQRVEVLGISCCVVSLVVLLLFFKVMGYFPFRRPGQDKPTQTHAIQPLFMFSRRGVFNVWQTPFIGESGVKWHKWARLAICHCVHSWGGGGGVGWEGRGVHGERITNWSRSSAQRPHLQLYFRTTSLQNHFLQSHQGIEKSATYIPLSV